MLTCELCLYVLRKGKDSDREDDGNSFEVNLHPVLDLYMSHPAKLCSGELLQG